MLGLDILITLINYLSETYFSVTLLCSSHLLWSLFLRSKRWTFLSTILIRNFIALSSIHYILQYQEIFPLLLRLLVCSVYQKRLINAELKCFSYLKASEKFRYQPFKLLSEIVFKTSFKGKVFCWFLFEPNKPHYVLTYYFRRSSAGVPFWSRDMFDNISSLIKPQKILR